MTEPTEIRLSIADLLAELTLGAMARVVEMDDDNEDIQIGASTSVIMIRHETYHHQNEHRMMWE